QYVPNPTGWVDPLGLNTCPGGEGCKPSVDAKSPKISANSNQDEPTLPYSQGEIVRVRHYTNRKGLNGIEQDGEILALDNNRVYVERARSKILSAADVQKRYQVDVSRGRDYVETDVPKHMLEEKRNPRYGSIELTIWGNLKLINPTFVRRK
ncbi:HYD1 signature containing ADP-ribosyltransferase family protein, partial [Pseudomonas marginalis]